MHKDVHKDSLSHFDTFTDCYSNTLQVISQHKIYML